MPIYSIRGCYLSVAQKQMAWENRNGRLYYYRKRRVGRRVVSEYLGTGEFTQLLLDMEETDRNRARAKRQAEQLEIAKWLALDQETNWALDMCSDLVSAALLLAGFHTHKGQWRRIHGRG